MVMKTCELWWENSIVFLNLHLVETEGVTRAIVGYLVRVSLMVW